MAARWADEKEALDRIKETTRSIDKLKIEADRAERSGDLERVAEIRYGDLPRLENELLESVEWDRGFSSMVEEEVDEDDVARWSAAGPVFRSRLLEGEVEKLIHMEEQSQRR